MFTLTSEMPPPKVGQVPFVPRLKESNVRQGYFEHQDYLAPKNAITFYLKRVTTMAYHTGMRKQEILSLKWRQADLLEDKITLKPEDTKSRESRIIYLKGELLQTVRFQLSLRNRKFPKIPWVFFWGDGRRADKRFSGRMGYRM